MAEDGRPKLMQIPQGRETTTHNIKAEDDEEDRRSRPKPLLHGDNDSNGNNNGRGNGGGVTLPSFREAWGSAIVDYPPPPPPPLSSHSQPSHSLHELARPVPAPGHPLYPDSPTPSRPGPLTEFAPPSFGLQGPPGGRSIPTPPAYPSLPPPPGPPPQHEHQSPQEQQSPHERRSPTEHSGYGPPPPTAHTGPPPPPGPPPGPPLQQVPGRSDQHDYYGRPPPEQGYHDGYNQDGKDYYGYSHFGHYPDRPAHPAYWHQMPPNYQQSPQETAPRQRTSIACKYCRKRKIRCSGYQNTPDGKCTNCKKTGNDCVFQPVSSTTSTAFVPVSAIQGGVPPGTPLYGAFGQPLGPNGGRGPSHPPSHLGYGPPSPGGYYHQQMPPHIDHGGARGPPPPPTQPGMPTRHLPPPYAQHPGYPDDPRRPLPNKRTREDDEMEYPPRLRPPPPPPHPTYTGHEIGHYRGAEDARRSPPVNGAGPGSAPSTTMSPTSNGQRAYGTPAPPVLPPPPLSAGTDSISDRSNSSASDIATSPSECLEKRPPPEGFNHWTYRSPYAWHAPPPHFAEPGIDPKDQWHLNDTMLNRLTSARL